MDSCTCSQATQNWQTCLYELLTSLNLLFRPWAWFGEMKVCQTLIRQEAREWGWARGGNSREGWKPKLLVRSQRRSGNLVFFLWTHKLEAIVFTPYWVEFPYSNELIPFELLWPVKFQASAQRRERRSLPKGWIPLLLLRWVMCVCSAWDGISSCSQWTLGRTQGTIWMAGPCSPLSPVLSFPTLPAYCP